MLRFNDNLTRLLFKIHYSKPIMDRKIRQIIPAVAAAVVVVLLVVVAAAILEPLAAPFVGF